MHTFPNGKVYIGITMRDPKDRWLGGLGYKDNNRMFNDIVKYGWENVSHNIIQDGLSELEARSLECELIAKYQSAKPEFGYNISTGYTSYKRINHRRKDVSSGWCLTRDKGTWAVRYRVFDSSEERWKNLSVALGMRISDYDVQTAMRVAERYVPLVIKMDSETRRKRSVNLKMERRLIISEITAHK